MARSDRTCLVLRRVLLAISLLAGAPAIAAETASSEWVHLDAFGKLVYKTTPSGDRIMDFSFAGYKGGGVAIPEVAVVRSIKPSGADDTANIQAAINEVEALPLKDGFRGALLLEPGTFACSGMLTISASGVVLRGSGAEGQQTTIKLVGQPHLAIDVREPSARARRGSRNAAADADKNFKPAQAKIADAYVPSGTNSFNVTDTTGFAVGDTIAIHRPVTQTWVKFMQMDDLMRDGKPQTWIRVGTHTTAERKILAIEGKRITVDVPLSDSYDARYLDPPGTEVVKIAPPKLVTNVGIENLHIESPPQPINHTQPHFSAIKIVGEDCWASNLIIDETMNSVGVNGRRITLQNVAVNRKAAHVGSSKPAEFAPDGTQVLLDRCSVSADNVWFSATGAGVSGPIVLLNCTFHGNGRAESHQRWSTGILYDNCQAPQGGIEMRNRGSMGTGHGWSMGWGVLWNCQAKEFLVQNPPGALNWMIGCTGKATNAARPFGSRPLLPQGVVDSPDKPVSPHSLYLQQLAQRLGPQALHNIGY